VKPRHGLSLLALALVLAGCGSGGGGNGTITIDHPKTVHVADFTPTGPVQAGKPFTVSFTIQQPDGSTLTTYKTGSGPHTGVHLIFVRRDLAVLVHLHPAIGKDGRIELPVTLPTAGPYELLIDVYASIPGQPFPNFQLRENVKVAGAYAPRRLAPFRAVQSVDGYTFRMTSPPRIKSLTAAYLVVHVTGPDGKPARFTPFYGALAHAIFFRAGAQLDYFHTHVCSPDAPNCAGRPGAPTTRTSVPGLIKASAILPLAGAWEVFVQCRIEGRVLTVPFTITAT
jgi:hypothetical protein